MIDTIVHADWSVHARGRWAATARRDGLGWRVDAPQPVGDLAAFCSALLASARTRTVLAGFDFPIGVPAAYGVATGLNDFREALARFGAAEGWIDFYRPATTAAEVTITRPFYPAGSGAGTKQATLVTGLGLGSADALLRACERGALGRKRASPLFWTVGPAQVGRAAGVGWREVLVPALNAGAALWPFDGTLDALTAGPGLVLAETYPADAYAEVGAPFRPGESKRRQADRAGKADAVLSWAAARGVDATACENVLRDGFGAATSGEDPFDALLGLLAMIPVADDPQRAMSIQMTPEQARWEGWILGR